MTIIVGAGERPKFRRQLAEAGEGRGPEDCHPWPGNHSASGYGRYGQAYAHVLVVEAEGIEVPPGFEVDHLCHTRDPSCPGGPSCPHRGCVNRTHLEVVPKLENWLRGRSHVVTCALRENCGTCGQPYDAVSHTERDGTVRRCSSCTRRSNRAAYARAHG